MTTAEDLTDEYLDYMHSVGRRIKQLRQELGLTLRDMVVLHGYHESHWRRMEREGAGLQSLLRISKIFGLTVSCILDGVGELPQTIYSMRDLAKAPRSDKKMKVESGELTKSRKRT